MPPKIIYPLRNIYLNSEHLHRMDDSIVFVNVIFDNLPIKHSPDVQTSSTLKLKDVELQISVLFNNLKTLTVERMIGVHCPLSSTMNVVIKSILFLRLRSVCRHH